MQRTRWPEEMSDSGWTYGANLSYMKELAEYWLTRFNWRKVEEQINSFPSFVADIDGYIIHFLLIRWYGLCEGRQRSDSVQKIG
ncbi:MAG: epoxide hydrolase N-terminal domain-containing protein [Bacteroidota bacterium]